MVEVLISYSKLVNNKDQVSVSFENIIDFQFSKYMNSLVLDFREYMYLLEFSGNARIPRVNQGIRVFTKSL